ncbi:recombinase family protein [uncultured Oscillibacter sp.]|uniref:recombinase family protein n=1 Tax=uncultured Oscillibacter sp. TaxID=876091 RepID=UPI0025F17ED5|nr:recombinase family protein [uncultured Oscillibacter sp.]
MEQAVREKRIRIIPATKEPQTAGRPSGRKLRVAAYCRVSTDSEDQLTSYTAQKEYYTQKIEENPDWELAGIFADRGITGTSMKKRAEFNRMIAACKRGRIDIILTKSLSRFARNTVDCLETVRILRARGIGVRFEKEGIDTLTESGEFMITLFSGFAQAESESIRNNVIWGILKSREAGNVPFQYTKLLGYRRGAEGNPEIDQSEAEVVRRIYRRYLDGASIFGIQKELERDHVPTATGVKQWSWQTIRNILINERYMGDALLQKTYTVDCISKEVRKNNGEFPMVYVENNHPAIISRDMFYRVKAEMTRRASKRKVMQKSGKTEQGKYSAKYALSELLVCGECGTPYKRCTWARNGKKRIVWRCISRLEFGTKYCHGSPTLDEDRLHRAVVAALNEYGAIRVEVKAGVLELAGLAQSHGEGDGVSLLELKQRLDALTAEQALLLDKILEDMDNLELNSQLEAVTAEKQDILDQMQALEKDESQRSLRASRQREMEAWLDQQAMRFTEYEDSVTRRFVERITVVDANTIQVKIKDIDVVISEGLC